jgi:LPXTG-motif cell wall-anchored protein
MSRFVSKLKDLAPYAALELVMPGGSLMALALWLYRRKKKDAASADSKNDVL